MRSSGAQRRGGNVACGEDEGAGGEPGIAEPCGHAAMRKKVKTGATAIGTGTIHQGA